MQEELLLAETFREAMSIGWSQLQWWASVSFGLLVLASLGRQYLGLLATAGLSVLYILFTVFTVINVMLISDTAYSAIYDLQTLQETRSLTAVGEDIVRAESEIIRSGLFLGMCFVATFLGVTVYLWYSYFRNKRATE